MHKVQILLSSYNGEKYIRQQLDSIFNQEGLELHCLVRDDGSTDNTLDVLYEYQNKYDKLEVIRGHNIGYKASFMKLMDKSGEYDFYAFADQDDVWLPSKILKATEQISDVGGESPVMYHSNCTLVDSNLNYIAMLHTKDIITPSSKVKALVQGFVHGCTMVFNYDARNLILKYNPKKETAHDFWIPLIFVYLGKIIYDKESYILYRQHSDNVFGNHSSIQTIFKGMKMRYLDKSFYSDIVNEVLNGYGDYLKSEDSEILNEISVYKSSIYKKTKLLFNKQLKRDTFKGTLFLKFLIIFSRF